MKRNFSTVTRVFCLFGDFFYLNDIQRYERKKPIQAIGRHIYVHPLFRNTLHENVSIFCKVLLQYLDPVLKTRIRFGPKRILDQVLLNTCQSTELFFNGTKIQLSNIGYTCCIECKEGSFNVNYSHLEELKNKYLSCFSSIRQKSLDTTWIQNTFSPFLCLFCKVWRHRRAMS